MTEARFEQCIRRMNEGDKEGLKEIYEEYVPYIYGIVWQMLKNKENAEDITSEFFIRLWDKSDKYKAGNGHRGWMATIARNMAVDFIRKHRREELTDLLTGREEDTQDRYGQTQLSQAVIAVQGLEEGSADSQVEQEVLEGISIREALEQLNEKERIVVHMKIMGEMTFKEISQALDTPMGTVQWRYREAINKLRRCGYE